jgi:hypothetical protein
MGPLGAILFDACSVGCQMVSLRSSTATHDSLLRLEMLPDDDEERLVYPR